MDSAGRVILISGATSGIGLALAERYARESCRLILMGRRARSSLPPLFQKHTYINTDLEDAKTPEVFIRSLQEAEIREIDLAILNAGQAYVGSFTDQPAARISSLVGVNLLAPILLSHALIPYLRKRRGKLAFISSVVSSLPTPDYMVYTATKAALDGFARSLRAELGSEIRVQVVHPGAARTPLHQKAGATFSTEKFPTPALVARRIALALKRDERASFLRPQDRLLHGAGRHLDFVIDPIWRGMRRKGAPASERQAPQPLAVVTGAADGIGLALCRRLVDEGYRILGIDVDSERSAEAQGRLRNAGGRVDFLQADLSRDESIADLLSALDHVGPIDLLAHSAGINAFGRFQEVKAEEQSRVVKVNLVAPMLLTRGLLAGGQLGRGSSIVLIASLSTFLSYPGAPGYAASKDGIASFARSLGITLTPRGIHVLTVFPGPTRTAHARRYSPDNTKEERRMDPQRVGDEIVAAVERRSSTLIPGWTNRLMAIGGRVAPRLVEMAMRRTLYDKLP